MENCNTVPDPDMSVTNERDHDAPVFGNPYLLLGQYSGYNIPADKNPIFFGPEGQAGQMTIGLGGNTPSINSHSNINHGDGGLLALVDTNETALLESASNQELTIDWGLEYPLNLPDPDNGGVDLALSPIPAFGNEGYANMTNEEVPPSQVGFGGTLNSHPTLIGSAIPIPLGVAFGAPNIPVYPGNPTWGLGPAAAAAAPSAFCVTDQYIPPPLPGTSGDQGLSEAAVLNISNQDGQSTAAPPQITKSSKKCGKSERPRKMRKYGPKTERATYQEGYRERKNEEDMEKTRKLKELNEKNPLSHGDTVTMIENMAHLMKAGVVGGIIVSQRLAEKPAAKLTKEEIQQIVDDAAEQGSNIRYKQIFDIDDKDTLTGVKIG